MSNIATPILLLLYAMILVGSYCVVRRGWLRAYPSFVVSFVGNALVLFVFSLTRGNSLLQATLVSLATAFVFSALSVTLAVLFRNPGVATAHESVPVKQTLRGSLSM
jgi:hypothetical protein